MVGQHPKRSGKIDAVAATAARVLPRKSTPTVDRVRNDVATMVARAKGTTPSPLVGDATPKPLNDVDPLDLLPRRIADGMRRIRGDAKMVGNRLLLGKMPSPTIVRPPRGKDASVVSLPNASPILTRPLKVTRVERETADAVSVYLTEQDGSAVAFEPGQFLSVDVQMDGNVLRRAYSLAGPSLPGHDTHITVKRMPEGRVSNFINDEIKEGDLLQVLGPSGNFTVSPSAMMSRHLIMVAGGSGITPIMSIVHTVLSIEKHSRVTLVYGNRGPADIIFCERIRTLEEEHGDRLTVDHVLSDPPEGWTGGVGMLTEEVLRERLPNDTSADCRYFVCGPTPMIDAAHETLRGFGIPAERILEERFTHPEDRAAQRGSESTQLVIVRTNGREQGVRVQPGQTVLEAALAAGVHLPFSCAMGGCGACRAKCSSGEVVMDEPNCLSQRERDAGYVLTCVGRPMSLCSIDAER